MNNIQILMLGVMGMILLVGAIICLTTIKKQGTVYVKPIIKQGCFILTIGSLFNLAAACSKCVSAKPTIFIYILWTLTVVLLVFCVITRNRKKTPKAEIKKVLKEQKYLWIVLGFSAVVRIVLIHDITIQRWDAGQYYYALGTACENYEFTLGSAWGIFRLANHSTFGFSLLMGIGEFLNPRGVQGVLYINLILTIAALYCIYGLLRKYCANFNDKQASIGTLLVSVSPLFLGTCGYVNVDYVLALAFIFMIYCEYKKWNLLLFFWGVILVQTKETGLFVFAGYFIGHFIYWMLKKSGSFLKRFIAVFDEKITWATMGVVFSHGIYVLRLGAFTAWEQTTGAGSKVLWSNTGMNCFGFQPQNISVKCLQFFILNFAWVLLALLFFLVVYAYARKQKMNLYTSNMQGIFGGMGAFVIFSFIYVTWDIERYNVLFVVLYVFVLYVLCEKLFVQNNFCEKKKVAAWGLIGILFVIQTFSPIDVVSNKAFQVVDTGKKKMLYTSKSSDYYGDCLVNNYQYIWIDKAIDSVLQEIGYHENITILTPGEQVRGTHVNGNGTAYSVFWDIQKNRRVMYQNENTCKINVIGDLKGFKNKPENMVALFLPYYEIDEEKSLSEYKDSYTIGERNILEESGGFISYYYMGKK